MDSGILLSFLVVKILLLEAAITHLQTVPRHRMCFWKCSPSYLLSVDIDCKILVLCSEEFIDIYMGCHSKSHRVPQTLCVNITESAELEGTHLDHGV